MLLNDIALLTLFIWFRFIDHRVQSTNSLCEFTGVADHDQISAVADRFKKDAITALVHDGNGGIANEAKAEPIAPWVGSFHSKRDDAVGRNGLLKRGNQDHPNSIVLEFGGVVTHASSPRGHTGESPHDDDKAPRS